jgi:hypothetical protein
MAASFPLDPRYILYVLRDHIVINPFLEITSRRFRWWWKKFSTNTIQKNITVNYNIINICNVNVELKLPSSASPCPNPNGMDRWVEGKTNTSCRTYRALNSCGDNLSRICIMVFLRRSDISHHDLDHLVEDNYSSP